MDARLISFGVLEIDGKRYEHDVVIESGIIHKRKKGPSKAQQDTYGHTPLSADEAIPWSTPVLIIGTGVSGQLPVTLGVYEEARRREVEVIAEPTEAACRRLTALKTGDFAAIMHVTC